MAVDALRDTGYDNRAGASQLQTQPGGHGFSVFTALPGAHHANGQLPVEIGQLTFIIQHRWRVGDVLQTVGIMRILNGQQRDAQLLTLRQNLLGDIHAFVAEGTAGRFAQILF